MEPRPRGRLKTAARSPERKGRSLIASRDRPCLSSDQRWLLPGGGRDRLLGDVAPSRPHESEKRARLRANPSRWIARPRTRSESKPGRVTAPERVRGAQPTFLHRLVASRRARRELSLLGGIVGLFVILAVSGARIVREDIGHVGVVRNGAPWSNRAIHKIVDPGSGPTWGGWFSQRPREYPASQVSRIYTITADPSRGARNESDVVTVPTKDGVQIGLEGTVFYHFIGERDKAALRTFDRSIGTRKFADEKGALLYPWQGDEGWEAMIDAVFRPLLDNIVRGELGQFQCGQLVPSCVLIH